MAYTFAIQGAAVAAVAALLARSALCAVVRLCAGGGEEGWPAALCTDRGRG